MDFETQTSESLDTTEDFDLFADDDTEEFAEQTSDADTDVTSQQTEPQGQEQQKGTEDNSAHTMLNIVYNGQPMQLTEEQAVQLAQKGMNYDRKMESLRKEYEARAANSPERLMLAQLAQQAGLPYDQFLNQFQNQMRQSTIQVRAEQLAQSGAMDMNTAMMLARSEIEKEELQNQRNAEEMKRQQFKQQFEQRQMAEAQRKERFAREVGELVKENPDFQKTYPTVESMPKVMQDAILNGGSIKAAYQQVVIEQLRTENAAYKQNQINKEQSPGSASGSRPNTSDAFLSGLFGDD
ncbi:MAG: hypothetical protein J6K99_07240 [Peptococcaceae bacterium]|nr:hypothetical protein [Peptococcaceae bacterium]